MPEPPGRTPSKTGGTDPVDDTDPVSDIDLAVAAWLRHERRQSLRTLLALGPPALRRVIQLYYGGTRSAVIDEAQRHRHARELVDAWAVMIGAVARAHPQAYLDEIDAGRVRLGERPTLELGILGDIELPGVVPLLARYRTSPEFLVRHQVVRGLGWRADAVSVAATETAVTDEERTIRDEAARQLRRRDPDAAIRRYQRLLDDPELPAALRGELTGKLAAARRQRAGSDAG